VSVMRDKSDLARQRERRPRAARDQMTSR
jgi:hypothetical protein